MNDIEREVHEQKTLSEVFPFMNVCLINYSRHEKYYGQTIVCHSFTSVNYIVYHASYSICHGIYIATIGKIYLP